MQTFRAAADFSEGHPQLPRVTAAAWVSPTVATARPCSTPRDGPSNREGFRAANEMGRGCPCLPPDPRLGYQGCSLGLKGRARRGSLTAWREGAQVLGVLTAGLGSGRMARPSFQRAITQQFS